MQQAVHVPVVQGPENLLVHFRGERVQRGIVGDGGGGGVDDREYLLDHFLGEERQLAAQ